MKRVKQIISMLLIVFCVGMTNIALYAATPEPGKIDVNDATKFLKNRQANEKVTNAIEKINDAGFSVHTLIQAGLFVIGFILLTLRGVLMWIHSNDSTKKKEIKGSLAWFVVGAFFCFGTSFLYVLIMTFVSSF